MGMPDDDKLDKLWKKIQSNQEEYDRKLKNGEASVTWSAAARSDNEVFQVGHKTEGIGFVGKNLENGHFAGEMRLALQTAADGTVTALTGGSVNGNIITAQKKLVFSKERYSDSTYEGPLAVMIADVTVAGE